MPHLRQQEVPKGGGRQLIGQSYSVAGKRYTPYQKPVGYTAVGTASWYGEAFRRQKRLPDLETLLTPQDELAEQTADDIFAVLLQMQAAGAHMTIEEVDESWLLQ